MNINYMFRPNPAIIRFTSEGVLVLYRIYAVLSRWWDLFIRLLIIIIIIIINTTDEETSPSLHNRTNPIKQWYSFGWKPDYGWNRPKHVVDIHHLINIIRKSVVLLTKYPYLFIYTQTTGMVHFRSTAWCQQSGHSQQATHLMALRAACWRPQWRHSSQ